MFPVTLFNGLLRLLCFPGVRQQPSPRRLPHYILSSVEITVTARGANPRGPAAWAPSLTQGPLSQGVAWGLGFFICKVKEVESPNSCRPPSLLLPLSFSSVKAFRPQEDREDWCRTPLRDPAGPAARAHSFPSMLDALSPYGPRIDADRNLKVERGQAWESTRAGPLWLAADHA